MSTHTPAWVRRRLAAVVTVAAAVALLAGASPAAAQARSPAGSPGSARAVSGGIWGTAIEVPGTAALNTVGLAYTSAMSCASAGNCSAGGFYIDSSGHNQAFVVSQVNGRWGTAKEVPGTAALNTGGNAQIDSVSCAKAGNCSAGGFYTDSSSHGQGFVVSQVNGRWGTAKEVPGGGISSVSCASAGNCSAGGGLDVVSQVNGKWGTAEQVPGLAALNTGLAGIDPIECDFTCDPVAGLLSCASAGNCSAGGFYDDNTGRVQAFVVSQAGGRWATAKEVAANLNTAAHAGAGIESVSCASAGNCSAGGVYNLGAGQAFVVSEVNGRWDTAKEVPGTAALNTGGNAAVQSLSCASAGNCSAGGYYTDNFRSPHAFVVSQVNGRWGTAKEVAANLRGPLIYSLSCAPAGNCSAGGGYTDSSGHQQAFVVSQT